MSQRMSTPRSFNSCNRPVIPLKSPSLEKFRVKIAYTTELLSQSGDLRALGPDDSASAPMAGLSVSEAMTVAANRQFSLCRIKFMLLVGDGGFVDWECESSHARETATAELKTPTAVGSGDWLGPV